MPLVYRAILQDHDGSISGSVEGLFLDWLVDKRLVGDDFRLMPGASMALPASESPAWLQHQVAAATRAGAEGIRRLRLVEETHEGRWITSLTWRRPSPQQQFLDLTIPQPVTQLSMADESPLAAWVWIDLEHEPAAGRPLLRPGSPKIVRALMAAGEAYDSELPLTAEAYTVRQPHVPELVGYIQDSARNVPVIVFAFDGQGAYDQKDLARRLARDLAGVAAVFVLADSQTNQALAAALPPEYAVYAGALRTYLPGACAEEDAPTRHRVLGRISLAALGPRAFPALKDQVLKTSTRRPGPIDSFIVRRLATPEPARKVVPAPSDGSSSPLLWFSEQVRRIGELLGQPGAETAFDKLPTAEAALAAKIDALLDRALATTHHAPQGADSSGRRETDQQLATIEADRQVLEQLFKESSDELESVHNTLSLVREDRDLLELELADAARDADKIRRKAAFLSRQLAARGEPPLADEPQLEVPTSVAEVVLLARSSLQHVVVGPTDRDAAELDVHSGASLYAAKAWDALLALDAYAAARQKCVFAGGFRQWCLEAEDGAAAVSAQAVAMGESETVDTTPALSSRRVFPVPKEVSPDEQQYMPAHIKLVRRGEAAPRLHFYDDAGGQTGKVYVGYIGPHLPTARFG